MLTKRIADCVQHHRLPPASGPAPSALAAGSSARLNELLDLIKVEFESAGVEGSQWKVQRDEYEGKSESLLIIYATSTWKMPHRAG